MSLAGSSKRLKKNIRTFGNLPQGHPKLRIRLAESPGAYRAADAFLSAMKRGMGGDSRPRWDIRQCPPHIRQACPAWEFNAGHLCWFISGTICRGKNLRTWRKKMRVCRKCEVFISTMKRRSLSLPLLKNLNFLTGRNLYLFHIPAAFSIKKHPARNATQLV